MFTLIRWAATAAYAWLVWYRVRDLDSSSVLWGAWVLVELVVTGFVIALLWAPAIGEKISDPLTSTFVEDTGTNRRDRLVRWIAALQASGWHRLALALCFVEGVRKPDALHPPLLGIQSVRPGSTLERWFALEIYRHNHAGHCIRAAQILRERHHLEPPLHTSAEIVRLLARAQPRIVPPATTIALPPAAPSLQVQRNPSIQLFKSTPNPADPKDSSSTESTSS